MIYVCVICMVKRPPLSPMEAEYRRLLEAVVSPFINTEELKACQHHWLLCTHCKLFMQTLYNFQQTALVGVKNLKCLLYKLNTQTIKDTTPRVVSVKIEPHVATAAPKEEFITDEGPTNIEDSTPKVVTIKTEEEFIPVEEPINGNREQGDPLTEEVHLKFERWPPESEHQPGFQDCKFDSTMSCGSNTNVQNIQHPASISASSVQQVQIQRMDATAGSEGKFEVLTNEPQPGQKPRLPNTQQKDGVREGPKRRIRTRGPPKKPVSVTCPQCGKSVLNTTLKTHIRRKHVDAPCACDVCGKQYRNQASLKDHKKQHMKKKAKTVDDMGPDPKLFCQPCAVQFSCRYVYKKHLRTLKHIPRDQYQFECETCKKRFLDKSRLQKHIDFVHLGQRRYKCEQCGKAYDTAQKVRRHIADAHENALPKHVCHLCGKTFKIRHNWEEHLLSHEGLRPHQCPLCPATFTYKAALFTHNQLKHLKIKRKWKKKKVAEKERIPEEEKADSND